MLKLLLQIIFLATVLSVTLQFCKPKEKIAPDIPPIESITINLSYFNSEAIENSYYEDAKESLKTWISIINDSLLFQKNFYETILEYPLDYQSENTWLIDTDKDHIDDKYNLKFFEIVDADTVFSKFFVSKYWLNADTLIYTNILMDGQIYNENSYGNWIINKPDTANTYIKFLDVDWKINNNVNPELKMTNSLEGGDNGNYILYKDTLDSGFDSYLLLFNKADENNTTIEWNNQTKQGRIKDFNLYGDENWYCWNENFQDIVCQ